MATDAGVPIKTVLASQAELKAKVQTKPDAAPVVQEHA